MRLGDFLRAAHLAAVHGPEHDVVPPGVPATAWRVRASRDDRPLVEDGPPFGIGSDHQAISSRLADHGVPHRATGASALRADFDDVSVAIAPDPERRTARPVMRALAVHAPLAVHAAGTVAVDGNAGRWEPSGGKRIRLRVRDGAAGLEAMLSLAADAALAMRFHEDPERWHADGDDEAVLAMLPGCGRMRGPSFLLGIDDGTGIEHPGQARSPQGDALAAIAAWYGPEAADPPARPEAAPRLLLPLPRPAAATLRASNRLAVEAATRRLAAFEAMAATACA